MGRGQELLNLVKSIKQQKELQDIGQTISEQIKPENIKAGVEVFGVQGDANVVDTSEGTINAENITPDAIAFSKGQKITGAMLATTAENPLVVSGDYTALNQEYPYFLLRRPSGSKFGSSMVKVNAAAIPQEWIEGKNMILRYNFDSTTNTGHLELAITDWGNRFAFSYNGSKLEFSVKDSLTGESRSCQSYECQATVEELLTLTADKWKGPYGSTRLGAIKTLYAYSRDESIKTTSYGGSDGIPSNNQLISFEKNITGYEGRSVYAPAGGKEIVYLPKSTIATKENITSEKIIAGNTVLGVQGNAIEFLPNPTFIAEAVNKYSGPTIINKKMTSASNITSFSYSISAQIGKRVIAFMSLLNNPSYTSNPATPNEIEGWELVHRLQSGNYNNWRNWTTYIYTKIAESETETITFTTQETCGAVDICLAAFDSSDEVEVLTSVTGWKALTGYAQPIKIGDLIFDSYMTTQELTVIGPKYTSYGNKRSYLITVNTDANQVSLDRKYDYTHNTVILRFKTQNAEVLKPENIKKGVKILNVIGTLETTIEEEGPSKEELQARIAELEAEIAEANIIIDQLNGEEV